MLYLLVFGQVIGCFMGIYTVWYMRHNRFEYEKMASNREAKIIELERQMRLVLELVQQAEPREQYKKIGWVINREHPRALEIALKIAPFMVSHGRTMSASWDDICGGRLLDKNAVAFLFDGEEQKYIPWANVWYTGTKLRFIPEGEIDQYLDNERNKDKEKAPA